jgi:hypothetical protein
MTKNASGFSSRRNRVYDDDQSQDEEGQDYLASEPAGEITYVNT